MRAACEKLFQRYLKRFDSRPGVFVQAGKTMVIVETKQWKLSYSSMERAKFDLTDGAGLFIEGAGEDTGMRLIPWNMVLRITVNEA